MSELRTIKKYPNRRLYDTAISSYITLEDVKRLVLENVSIQVIDARSKQDITHNTLLQIILELEENGPPIFSTDVLQQMVRFYGGALQNVISQTLEHAMSFFSEKHVQIKQGAEGMERFVEQDLFSQIADSTKKDEQSWQSMHQKWVQAITNPHSVTESLKREEAEVPAAFELNVRSAAE